MWTIALRKKIERSRKDFKRAQNAAHRMRPERSCWGKVTLRQSAPTWHRHRQISCTSAVSWAHSAAETDVFQDGKTQARNSKEEVGHRLGGRESCWSAHKASTAKSWGSLYRWGSHGQTKAWDKQGKSSSLLFLSPLSMETCLSTTGLCCEEGGSYSKELGLICQIVTECIWSCTWVTKRVYRLLSFYVMPEMKFFLSLDLMLSIRFTKHILKTLTLFSIYL